MVVDLRVADGQGRIGNHITWNLTTSYEFTDNLRGNLLIQNLFDQYPPNDNTQQFFDYPWYNIYLYSGAGIGRFASAELIWRFN